MRIYQRGKRGIWWIDATIAGQRITRSTGTTSRQQAEEYGARLAVDTWRTRRLGESPRVTFGQAVLHWMAAHTDTRRSIEDMKDRLRWLCGHFENTVLPISADALDAVLTTKDCSNATRNRHVAEVSKIHHHAHRQEWIDAVPAFRHYHEPKPEPQWLTREQADTLLVELPDHLADMAEFSLATGLRESNVRLLRWSQVDTARRVAWVLSGQAKNGRALSVPLNADAIAVLTRLRGRHTVYVFTYQREPSAREKAEGIEPKRGPVYNCSTAAWYKATKRAKVQGFRWHGLRHTWATWHVMNGTPLPVLQQLGGWSSYSMVLRYAHVAADYAAQYADGSLRDKSVTSASGKSRGFFPSDNAMKTNENLGWLTGLEPATTGITKRSSTAKLLNLNDALARKRRKTA